MKPFHVRGVLAAAALLTFSSGAMAQNNSYYNPSILPLPNTQPVAQTAYQVPQTGPLGGYRQSLASANQEAVDTPQAEAGSAVPDSAADEAAGGITGKWWKPWSTSSGDTGTQNPMAGMGGCGSSASCMTCNPCCGGARWFGSVGGLFMTRNTPNPFWTTYETNNDPNQLMNTKQAGNGLWGGGGQATFGRWWCPCACNNGCGCGPQYAYGVQFTYWQIADMNSSVIANGSAGGLDTPINFAGPNPVKIGNQTADTFFSSSQQQGIWRTDRFLNIELNGLVQPIYNNPGCFSCTLLAGFRYFRFQDILTYGGTQYGTNFGDNGGATEAFLQSNVTNNLFGGQIGTLLNFAVTPSFGFFALPKGGVFGNQINITNSLQSGNGVYGFNYHASQTVCSLMGELDTGVYWWMCPNAQLFFGWRVVGVTNVALADNQFLPYLQDAAGFQTVKSNGDLILTGGFGGIAFAF